MNNRFNKILKSFLKYFLLLTFYLCANFIISKNSAPLQIARHPRLFTVNPVENFERAI